MTQRPRMVSNWAGPDWVGTNAIATRRLVIVPEPSDSGPTEIVLTPWTVGGPAGIVENRVVKAADAGGAGPSASGRALSNAPSSAAAIASSRRRRRARITVAAGAMRIMGCPS